MAKCSEGIWLSGKTLDCRPRDCEFDPLTPTKITNRRYVLVLPRKNASVYLCFTLGTLKNLVCHVWWALQYICILHYGPLMKTNYLYAPTPNGQSPSASLNKSNTPSRLFFLRRIVLCVVKITPGQCRSLSSFKYTKQQIPYSPLKTKLLNFRL